MLFHQSLRMLCDLKSYKHHHQSKILRKPLQLSKMYHSQATKILLLLSCFLYYTNNQILTQLEAGDKFATNQLDHIYKLIQLIPCLATTEGCTDFNNLGGLTSVVGDGCLRITLEFKSNSLLCERHHKASNNFLNSNKEVTVSRMYVSDLFELLDNQPSDFDSQITREEKYRLNDLSLNQPEEQTDGSQITYGTGSTTSIVDTRETDRLCSIWENSAGKYYIYHLMMDGNKKLLSDCISRMNNRKQQWDRESKVTPTLNTKVATKSFVEDEADSGSSSTRNKRWQAQQLHFRDGPATRSTQPGSGLVLASSSTGGLNSNLEEMELIGDRDRTPTREDNSRLRKFMLEMARHRQQHSLSNQQNPDSQDNRQSPVYKIYFQDPRNRLRSLVRMERKKINSIASDDASNSIKRPRHLRVASENQFTNGKRGRSSGGGGDGEPGRINSSSSAYNTSGSLSVEEKEQVKADLQVLIQHLSDRAELEKQTLPLDCEMRRYTFKATNSDRTGNICSGLVTAAICYGSCDTGEIADWLFPHKKSIHKVCTHGSRITRKVLLTNCNSLQAEQSLRQYQYVDAVNCACQRCNTDDTTCSGSLSQPLLRTTRFVEGDGEPENAPNLDSLAAGQLLESSFSKKTPLEGPLLTTNAPSNRRESPFLSRVQEMLAAFTGGDERASD